jgi:2'-hydroxyisoflavone reductase
MKVLVIGGTHFVGRAFVEAATAAGHEVTIFHRGRSEPAGLPDVEHVHGDRNDDLDQLAGRSWDAALDTCAYLPRSVRVAADVLSGAVAHYTLVSTLSVHPEDLPAGSREDAPMHEPPFPATAELTLETYGPLKVACEQEAQDGFAGRCLVVRPGYIVGPRDPSDRFTYYVRRAAGGGEMLAPGPPDAPLQVLDVRDLAAFMLDRIEQRAVGVYGTVGPSEPITMRDLLETTREVSGADTSFVWVAEGFLHARGDEAYEWFPMWEPQYPGAHTYDAGKARGDGLRTRSFADTVADTLAWDEERGRPTLRGGLTPAKERELLVAWREQT